MPPASPAQARSLPQTFSRALAAHIRALQWPETFSYVFSDLRNENIIKAGFYHFKFSNSRSRFNQTPQKRLRAGSLGKQCFNLIRVTFNLAHKLRVFQNTIATLVTQRNRVPTEAASNLAQRSIKNFLRTVDQAEIVADFFGHLHLVSREDNCFSGA